MIIGFTKNGCELIEFSLALAALINEGFAVSLEHTSFPLYYFSDFNMLHLFRPMLTTPSLTVAASRTALHQWSVVQQPPLCAFMETFSTTLPRLDVRKPFTVTPLRLRLQLPT